MNRMGDEATGKVDNELFQMELLFEIPQVRPTHRLLCDG